jgi:hypothetical protein
MSSLAARFCAGLGLRTADGGLTETANCELTADWETNCELRTNSVSDSALARSNEASSLAWNRSEKEAADFLELFKARANDVWAKDWLRALKPHHALSDGTEGILENVGPFFSGAA